uniref:Cyst nematode resistance protein-like protein n=1 Tax=Oryza sativa subsp. japonica TaxID=39947 RepID=Q6Z0B6_ORYSJ|nr:cyst nematode resistance protein-like protein [Oryza sativa Japonica Group]BAD05668.1 cyst nematode resistance protein-like protein [Oryza sativa Japonica Group]
MDQDKEQQLSLNQEDDTIRWKLTPDGFFSVSSAYDLFFMAREVSLSGQLVWQTKAPSKVRFFLWLATKSRCLTADNLAKRGWPHQDQCVLCQRQQEDCLHLFVSCDYTKRVWRLLRDWINVDFPLPGQDGETLADWWLIARLRFRTGYRDNFDSVVLLPCLVGCCGRSAMLGFFSTDCRRRSSF